ncbi:hypothetical protein KJ039_03420 [bacterium]|nr:hypothetical protein [bacterium]
MTAEKDFVSSRDKVGVLLQYQKAWVADRATIKLAEKSRRIGLSWAEASDDTLYAAETNGDDVWYIGYNKDMALEFISDCANWARFYNLAAGEMEEVVIDDEDKDILSYRIKFASGKRITALSSRPTNLRGKQGRVVLDEAAFHESLHELLKAAIALTMWGGQVRIISTHNGDENAFNELINEVRAGKKPFSLHRITLDDALEQGLYKRICEVLKRDWSPEGQDAWKQELIDFYGECADEELHVIPSRGSGVYLPRVLVESCMDTDIPVLRWSCTREFTFQPDLIRQAEANDWCEENLLPLLKKLDPKRLHYFGEDFGRTGDLTVIMPRAELPGLVYPAPFVVELRNVPFKQQEQVLFYIVDRLPRFMAGAMDARGNGQYLAEVAAQKYGQKISQVMISTEWYREVMPKYKAAFEDRTIRLPRDADILDDHRAVKMEKGVARVPESFKGKGKDGGKRHGDAAIAGAMSEFAIRSEPYQKPEYEKVEGRKMQGAGAY